MSFGFDLIEFDEYGWLIRHTLLSLKELRVEISNRIILAITSPH